MSEPSDGRRSADLRDYLAAERTLLAWIRTGLALTGFGFVVARFGLFLQQLQIVQRAPSPETYGLSLWFGTALIGAGVVVNLLSGWHHARLIRTMDQGQGLRPHATNLALATSLFLAVVGLGMVIYLVSVLSVRDASHLHSVNNGEAAIVPHTDNGIVNKRSNHSVDETLERLKRTLEAKGITIFAIVDHAGEAKRVGLEMRPTQLAIFGSPSAGTPVMLAAPSIAIDLPLKILIWEGREGTVWVSYNSLTYLQERHGLPKELLQNIAVVESLAAAVAE